jgi:aspartyl protease family protein
MKNFSIWPSPAASMVKAARLLPLILALLPSYSLAEQARDSLLSQIQALQDQSGIRIEGLEKIQDEGKIQVSGNADQQIKQLFAHYNHITERNKKGKIDRIVILNKKQKPKDQRIVLPTHYAGNHFTVAVSVSGDGRLWQELEMVIDTGADLVVLPTSMIASIGLADSAFTPAKMQTANGIADAKIGMLKELRIAGEVVENVQAAFIADHLLGENRLLGMSVLGRYQLNIDENNRLVTLIKK